MKEEYTFEELDEIEDEDIYKGKERARELEEDEIEDWQEAWMEGYEEA